jgi:hypothetical protein
MIELAGMWLATALHSKLKLECVGVKWPGDECHSTFRHVFYHHSSEDQCVSLCCV